jgi:hypothetical protein
MNACVNDEALTGGHEEAICGFDHFAAAAQSVQRQLRQVAVQRR